MRILFYFFHTSLPPSVYLPFPSPNTLGCRGRLRSQQKKFKKFRPHARRDVCVHRANTTRRRGEREKENPKERNRQYFVRFIFVFMISLHPPRPYLPPSPLYRYANAIRESALIDVSRRSFGNPKLAIENHTNPKRSVFSE